MDRRPVVTRVDFDKALRKQGWNLSPVKERIIPSSQHPVMSAAIAISICAYPQTQNLSNGGKAHKYARALFAYMFRASQWVGDLKQLPPWVQHLKIERMWDCLRTGERNLMRSLVIRDLTTAALIKALQREKAVQGEVTTFTMQFAPDLKTIKFEIPVKKTADGLLLVGKTPNDSRSSLRAAIREHRSALAEFEGRSPRIEGIDEELFYQNTLTRFVRPVLQTSHILQVIWEAANKYHQESIERRIPIDQILMRKATWAKDIHVQAARHEAMAISNMRTLGMAGCSCKLVRLGPPSPDS